MDWHTFQYDPQFILAASVRLIVACALGGIIGFERESTHHKPAGFRTHILVSLGSCLTMLISQFAVTAYQGAASFDPTRIGAQVVSGIGFLGAGAIIRHGSSVKGITTAASIWAVACVGLACGIGFYSGAVLATLLIWLVLMYLKAVEQRLTCKNRIKSIDMEALCDYPVVEGLNEVMKEFGFKIQSLDISENQNSQRQRIQCMVECEKQDTDPILVASRIKEIRGVLKVSI